MLYPIGHALYMPLSGQIFFRVTRLLLLRNSQTTQYFWIATKKNVFLLYIYLGWPMELSVHRVALVFFLKICPFLRRGVDLLKRGRKLGSISVHLCLVQWLIREGCTDQCFNIFSGVGRCPQLTWPVPRAFVVGLWTLKPLPISLTCCHFARVYLSTWYVVFEIE